MGTSWMKTADKVASAGLILTLVASASGLVFQTSSVGIVDTAGWAQIGALPLVVAGAIRGSRWWLLVLFLIAVGGYLWLLEQGH